MKSEKFTSIECKPSSHLKDYIDYYWFLSHNEKSPQLYSILPDSCFDIILTLDNHELRSSRITGIWDTKFDILYEKPVTQIGVRFKLGALHRLIDYPINNLLNSSTLTNIEDLGIPKQVIHEALQVSYLQVIKKLEDHFMNRLRKVKPNRNANILKYVTTLSGNEPIEEISNNFGISSRQLRRIFKDELGTSPKKVLKLIKFKRFMINSDDLLYYDQSHLIKNFKSLCYVNFNSLKNSKDVRFLQYPNLNINYDKSSKRKTK